MPQPIDLLRAEFQYAVKIKELLESLVLQEVPRFTPPELFELLQDARKQVLDLAEAQNELMLRG